MNDTKPPHPASKTDPLSRNWVHELASCTHQDAYTRYTGKASNAIPPVVHRRVMAATMWLRILKLV